MTRPAAAARVLLCGFNNDTHIKWVADEIESLGGEPQILDLLGADAFSDHVKHRNGKVQVGDYELKNFVSVWNRLKIKLDPVFADREDRSRYLYEKEALHQYRGLFEISEDEGLLVANPGRASYRAFHKPFQLRVAQKCGLNIPETLATNELEKAVAFASRFPAVAVKVYDTPFIRGRDSEANRYIFTNIFTAEKIAAIPAKQFSCSIILLQQYIEKEYELRIVCGRRFCHAICINSQEFEITSKDWRRSEILPIYSAMQIESEPILSLRNYLEAMGLEYGAFDFVVDPAGKCWFLECNPDGQWALAQKHTGQNIARSYAKMLLKL